METIDTNLLNDLEAFLIARIDVNIDGMPNIAMILLQRLQEARKPPDGSCEVCGNSSSSAVCPGCA